LHYLHLSAMMLQIQKYSLYKRFLFSYIKYKMLVCNNMSSAPMKNNGKGETKLHNPTVI
jgi:hypothetical protein